MDAPEKIIEVMQEPTLEVELESTPTSATKVVPETENEVVSSKFMVKIIDDSRLMCSVHPNKHCLFVANTLFLQEKDNKDSKFVDVRLGLCDPEFWRSNEERAMGPAGWVGCAGTPSCSHCIGAKNPNKPYFEDRKTLLTINWVHDHDCKSLLEKYQFKVSTNCRGESIKPLVVKRRTKYICEKVRYNVIKKDGFDELLAAYQKMDEDMTALGICRDYNSYSDAYDYNDKLVTIEVAREDHAIESIVFSYVEEESSCLDVDEYELKFRMLQSDLKKNSLMISMLIIDCKFGGKC